MVGNKNGYKEIDVEDSIEIRGTNSVSISEQEVHISFMRDQKWAEIYVSDSTYITRLDKLCMINPVVYSVVAETSRGKTYRCEDKNFISFRSKKREISDEQKLAAGERMRKYQASKKN